MVKSQEMNSKVVTAMKFSTFKRHFSEGTKNIIRNGWMTFASASAVAITLLILGFFLLLAININHLVEVVENQVEISVELDLAIEDDQIKAVENEIKNIDGVKSVTFISKEEGLEQLREKLGNEQNLLDGLEGEENPLYDSFMVKVFDPSQLDEVATEIAAINLVTNVDYGKTTVDNLLKWTAWIKNIGLIFIVGLAFTAMFLISNTIKITIYARQREIEIMKLVGATNWFIRWPFFVEGFLLGVIGAIMPIIALVFSYKFLLDSVNSSLNMSFLQPLPLNPLAYQISFLLFAIGAFIGIWGSMMSVRRFLRI